MAKRIIVFMLSVLFILSNTTFAANWVYLQRQEGTRYGPCTEYFDADSVVKEKEKITFWLLWVLDEITPSNDVKKILFKHEVLLDQPMKKKISAMYTYDSANKEISRYPTLSSSGFYTVQPGSMAQEYIQRVLLYAKEGMEADVVQPNNITAPGPKWYKAAELPDCELYWDVNSLAVWPQNSLKHEVVVKVVWSEKGLEKRKAELAMFSKRFYPLAYEDVSYTLLSYQFLVEQNKCRILEVTDYNDAGYRITLLDGNEWHDIVDGSRDDIVRQSILNGGTTTNLIYLESGQTTSESNGDSSLAAGARVATISVKSVQ